MPSIFGVYEQELAHWARMRKRWPTTSAQCASTLKQVVEARERGECFTAAGRRLLDPPPWISDCVWNDARLSSASLFDEVVMLTQANERQLAFTAQLQLHLPKAAQ